MLPSSDCGKFFVSAATTIFNFFCFSEKHINNTFLICTFLNLNKGRFNTTNDDIK